MRARPTTREAVRTWLAARLKLAEVPEGIWRHEEVAECVDAYLAKRGGLTDIHGVSKRLLSLSRQVNRQIVTARKQQVAPLAPAPARFNGDVFNDYEKARIKAASTYFHIAAGMRDDVRAFRATFLGGQLLTNKQAVAFTSSPALRHLTPVQCAEWGIDYIKHTADVVDEYNDGSRHLAIAVDPPGAIHWATLQGEPNRHGIVYFDRESPECEPQIMEVWPGSVIDQLQRLGDTLAKAYGWYESAAIRFLLLDEKAVLRGYGMGLSQSFHSGAYRGEITLTLDAWLSAETVVRIYRLAQSCMADGVPPQASTRKLRVFQFVLDHCDDTGRRPPWRRLADAWNHEYPAECYEDFRLFRRDYQRGEQHLLDVPNGVGKRLDEALRIAGKHI